MRGVYYAAPDGGVGLTTKCTGDYMTLRKLEALLSVLLISALAAAGDSAPQFTAHTAGGETLTNDSLRGQVVLLQFWTTW